MKTWSDIKHGEIVFVILIISKIKKYGDQKPPTEPPMTGFLMGC